MRRGHASVIPRDMARLRASATGIQVPSELVDASGSEIPTLLARLKTTPHGLAQGEAERRLRLHGVNAVGTDRSHPRLRMLAKALLNPLVILLLVLAALSALTGDMRAATVMGLMVVLGVGLRFVQEARADTAAARLRTMISVTATVERDGTTREIPLAHVVPGEIVHLAAGDMIPADVRLISSKDLYVIQASLTGESLPAEKFDHMEDGAGRSPLELRNICFLGTSVGSGTATAVVVSTGGATYLGNMANAITDAPPPTSFDKGVTRFTWLMIRFIAIMVPLVFVINGLTKHDWHQAFFFAMAVAVGLTPEMLPMIATVCLSKGALAMSRKRVIVKRLNAIQNLGAMDILCTDKTGTLTMDKVVLKLHLDVRLDEDEAVLALAYTNSHFQTGLKNGLDRAVLSHHELHQDQGISEFRKLDEIPFDFQRKIMSVVVETPDHVVRLIAKGACEEIFQRCTLCEFGGTTVPLDQALRATVHAAYGKLSADGFRVLALAYRDIAVAVAGAGPAFSKKDEADLTLRGFIAFLDPPKETTAPAIQAIKALGVSLKVLTGDNDMVSRKICRDVGVPTEHVLTGAEIEAMDDAELASRVEQVTLFARLSPAHKQRIISALRGRGHVVGFMGDGINDAPALREADVGVSVDTAVDIAKEAADVVLLEKSLMVLEQGIIEGRKVFANILKYVRMSASSNFGNMFSVLGASTFLPYVPMLPIQVLLNNLLYDVSQVPIPTDEVDAEQLAAPRPWALDRITRFILFFGPCSSLFDYATFGVMLYAFDCWAPDKAALFQTGWFVESILTQTLIIHVIRTSRIPFVQSRASLPLILTTTSIMAFGMWLPYSPMADALGMVELPPLYWPLLAGMSLGYVLLTQGVKMLLLRKRWI
uniref:Magnesium-transporting ATPase, P-type 1 n=1 Tax=Nitratidesulfovibrio vulgaris (strain DSM 19637 / Miyazaki F) TaxID=883 RepID=B8DJS2_NITV9